MIVCLGAAVLLLAFAALPLGAIPDPRMSLVLAQHRIEIAGAGVTALLAAIVAFAFA